jgi:hypothetical protein
MYFPVGIKLIYFMIFYFFSGELCDSEIASLSSIKADHSLRESEEKYLVSQGTVELMGIAGRYRKRFPNLFSQKYANETFKVARSKYYYNSTYNTGGLMLYGDSAWT